MNDTTNNDEPTKWVQVPRVWLERLMPTIQKHSDAAMIHTAEWSLNNEPTKPTRERVAEALFYASRRDDWGVATEDEREAFYDMADSPHVLALFSKPSPSAGLSVAEQTSVTRSIDEEFMQEGGTTRHWVQALNRAGYVIAAQPSPSAPSAKPVRIEDMAPGTTFTAGLRDVSNSDRRWMVTERGLASSDGSSGVSSKWVDLSTIRDVTPPPALDRVRALADEVREVPWPGDEYPTEVQAWVAYGKQVEVAHEALTGNLAAALRDEQEGEPNE